jgi:hypothetical protein
MPSQHRLPIGSPVGYKTSACSQVGRFCGLFPRIATQPGFLRTIGANSASRAPGPRPRSVSGYMLFVVEKKTPSSAIRVGSKDIMTHEISLPSCHFREGIAPLTVEIGEADAAELRG